MMPTMLSLDNKKILIGVTGGIAAFKIPLLVRLLKKNGAVVQVVMTPAAHRFVTAETLSVVSGNSVYTHFFDGPNGHWNNHVEMGIWADLMVIAPATANTIAKMAHGISDNLLLTTYLSSRAPVLLAPAMDLDMYQHPSFIQNLDLLKSRGAIIEDAETGELASGLIGTGRMAEPETLFATIASLLSTPKTLLGKKVLITAGPTHENIDPVRFIGNYSSGKMGFALAQVFAEAGAEVHLVTGPVILPDPNGVKVSRIQSAREMHQICMNHASDTDIFVMSAAVADYRPEDIAEEKIKKTSDHLHLELVKNPDILSDLGAHKRKNQVLVGFALETHNELEHANDKLQRKNADLIVLNSLNHYGAGFGHDTNKITLVTQNQAHELPLKSKKEAAKDILNAVLELIQLKLT